MTRVEPAESVNKLQTLCIKNRTQMSTSADQPAYSVEGQSVVAIVIPSFAGIDRPSLGAHLPQASALHAWSVF